MEIVRFSEITGGSASTGTPFIKFKVEGDGECTADSTLYFAEGINRKISVETIYIWLAITNNLDIDLDKDKVKALMPSGDSWEEIAGKLSTLMVGKPFSMLLKGEWVNPTDLCKPSWLKATLSNVVESAANKAMLVYNPTKDINPKKPKDNRPANNPGGNTQQATGGQPVVKSDGMPW